MADPDRFGADPDPAVKADADPAPDLKNFNLGREKISSTSSPILSKILPTLLYNFLSNNAVGGVLGERLIIKGKG